jgi:hypothetical protein
LILKFCREAKVFCFLNNTGILNDFYTTLVFFTETIREHISENAKAKELAESLYKEICPDSVDVQNILTIRRRKEAAPDPFNKGGKQY